MDFVSIDRLGIEHLLYPTLQKGRSQKERIATAGVFRTKIVNRPENESSESVPKYNLHYDGLLPGVLCVKNRSDAADVDHVEPASGLAT